MPLEVTDTIEGLVSSNPVGIDSTTEGNDHLQLLKVVLKNIFPGVGGQGWAIPVTATEAELNFSLGLTGNIQDQINQTASDAADNLAAEALTRGSADVGLGIRIDQEENDRIAADLLLNQLLVQEGIDRIAADGVLQANIDTEIGLRISGDSALQIQIDALNNAPPLVPAGTIMMFAQAAVPPGWVREDFAGDNRNLRIVSAVSGNVVGDFGGNASPIDMEQDVSHTHTTSPHQLTINEMPAHQHSVNQHSQSSLLSFGTDITIDHLFSQVQTGLTGNSNSHTHGPTGSSLTTVRFQPRYLNTMLCRKL